MANKISVKSTTKSHYAGLIYFFGQKLETFSEGKLRKRKNKVKSLIMKLNLLTLNMSIYIYDKGLKQCNLVLCASFHWFIKEALDCAQDHGL